jgi:hypothetical protein
MAGHAATAPQPCRVGTCRQKSKLADRQAGWTFLFGSAQNLVLLKAHVGIYMCTNSNNVMSRATARTSAATPVRAWPPAVQQPPAGQVGLEQ